MARSRQAVANDQANAVLLPRVRAADCSHARTRPLQSILTTRVKVLWRKVEVRRDLPRVRSLPRSANPQTSYHPAGSGPVPLCIHTQQIWVCSVLPLTCCGRIVVPCQVRGGGPCCWAGPDRRLCGTVCRTLPARLAESLPIHRLRWLPVSGFPFPPPQVKTRVWKRLDLRDPHCLKAEYHMLDSVS